jgi:hypothetical protein
VDPNLYIRGDGIFLLVYVNNISMLNLRMEVGTKAGIEVKAKLSEKYKIMDLGPARQFVGIEIHCDSTSTSLSLMTCINTKLKQFDMQSAYVAMTRINPNVMLGLAQHREEKELEDIKEYQAIVGSLIDIAVATHPDILFAVATLCRYNSHPFTSHMTAAKKVL